MQILQIKALSTYSSVDSLIAQTAAPSAPVNQLNEFYRSTQTSLGTFLPNLLGAIITFIIGIAIAAILASVTRSLLKRTDLDNRLAASLMGSDQRARQTNVEAIAGSIVFWIITVLATVAALNVLGLNSVAQPLNGFLNQIFGFLPRLGSAIVLAAIAWGLATVTKMIVTRAAHSFGLDEKLSDPADRNPNDPTANRFSLSETLGNALYWFIFLFFLPVILGVLQLQGPLQPVQNLLNEILAALPRILETILIGFIGWVIARVVRGIVTNLLSATGTDRIGNQFGVGQATGGRTFSWVLGTIVYVLILIPTAIAALDALQIQAISGPAVSMLNQILNAIPQIFTAALILAIGYIAGRFVANVVSTILTSIGFNNVFHWLGIRSVPLTPPSSSGPGIPRVSGDDPLYTVVDQRTQTATEEPPTPIAQSSIPQLTIGTPSEIVGIIALVGILLFATVAATNVLNIPALSLIVTGLLVVSGRILAGLVIFAVGLYLANFAYALITSSGSSRSRILGQTARIAIIALISAMALQQMGIASDIVNLAFGLLLGAVAVATAIAFGLGSRDVAGEQVRQWLNSFHQGRSSR